MLLVFWTSAMLACYFLLVSVHEVGHYLAGWAAGIPAAEMRIRLFTFPQHVALRDGERWVLPFDLESYFAVMRRHLLTTPRLYLYTAGGMLLETNCWGPVQSNRFGPDVRDAQDRTLAFFAKHMKPRPVVRGS